VGYAGGSTEDPTYHHLGDHSETVQIDYDPTVISYEELLDVFWGNHDPTGRPWSRQYQAFVFYHSDEQRRLAEETRDRVAERLRREVRTEVVPFSTFYLAEAYHQKYRLRQAPGIANEFRAMYPDDEDLVRSTAAARVNGYLGSNGSCEQLEEELSGLGLSASGRQNLLARVCGDS
jgi:methionine-S-sulfoxide reductase